MSRFQGQGGILILADGTCSHCHIPVEKREPAPAAPPAVSSIATAWAEIDSYCGHDEGCSTTDREEQDTGTCACGYRQAHTQMMTAVQRQQRVEEAAAPRKDHGSKAARVTEIANEAMESIETEDAEDYAHARSTIEWAINKALDEAAVPLLQEAAAALARILRNQPIGHGVDTARENSCVCRWCSAWRTVEALGLSPQAAQP